jgi:hypothetical protein
MRLSSKTVAAAQHRTIAAVQHMDIAAVQRMGVCCGAALQAPPT